MMTVATGEESERRLAEAMRAQALGAGRPGFAGRHPGVPAPPPTDPIRPSRPTPPRPSASRLNASAPGAAPRPAPADPPGLWAVLAESRVTLLFALFAGLLLGVALALLSLFVPGVLPAVG